MDDLRALRLAEALADMTWKAVVGWAPFEREALGKPLVQAADATGAQIAAALGRDPAGDTLANLYYARGSLFETKYWLNRAVARSLVDDRLLRDAVGQLAELARQLNALAAGARRQRAAPGTVRAVREPAEAYDGTEHWPAELITAPELAWLADPHTHTSDSPL